MNHLTQEELLLLADGESVAGAKAHLTACADCRAVAGELQGWLTAATSELRLAAPVETAEARSASWTRLRESMAVRAEELDAHLAPQEQLLALDEELSPARSAHLERCGVCADEAARVRTLLFDVANELRALIPAEPIGRRLAAAAALDARMAAPRPKKILVFPTRWVAAYAAAAAAAFALFSGWQTVSAPPANEPALVAQAPAVAAPAPFAPAPAIERTVSATAPVAASESLPAAEPPAPARAVELARYQPVEVAIPAPAETALAAIAPEAMAPPAPAAPPVAWASAPAPVLPAPQRVDAVAAPRAEEQNAGAVLAGLRAAVRAGVWSQDPRPVWRGERIVFEGRVESAEAAERYRAAILREWRKQDGGAGPAFELTAAASAPSAAPAPMAGASGRPAGGAARSALVEHYRDAARRSFQSPTPSVIDNEIVRYTTEILRLQSALTRHAYALRSVAAEFDDAVLDPEGRAIRADLVRFHAAAVAEREADLYARISEVLPRKYWNHRATRRDGAPAVSEREAAEAVLADALRLDASLTALLGSGAATVEAGAASPGELLARLRQGARQLTAQAGE